MQVQHTKSLRPTQAADFLGISVPALWKLLKNKLAPPPLLEAIPALHGLRLGGADHLA